MGQKLVYMPECHSTNDIALQLSHENAPEGTVAVTDNQTGGRGQRGNTWTAEPGKNLTFSVLLRPTFLSPSHQFYLNIFSSLSVYHALSGYVDYALSIKWPNDILIQEYKVGGILIENQLSGNRFSSSIVGIGLNVNQSPFAIDMASSLSVLRGQTFSLPMVFESLMQSLEEQYLRLRAQKFDDMKEEYLSLLCGFGQERWFVAGDRRFTGKITGIDPTGKLVVDIKGQALAFDIKDIHMPRIPLPPKQG